MTSSSSPATPGPGRRPTASLERRLPLLTTALLVAMLGLTLGLAYVAVERSVETASLEQLQSATQVLGEQVDGNLGRTLTTLRRQAATPALRALLREAARGASLDSAAVQAALAPLRPAGDSTSSPVELWTDDGRRIAAIGDPVARTDGDQAASVPRIASAGVEVIASDTSAAADDDEARSATGHVGDFHAEAGRAHFWLVAPVDTGAPAGFVAVRRRINPSPTVSERLRGLVGDEVTGYFASRDERQWFTLGGDPVARPATAGLLVAADTLVRAPIRLVLHQPRGAVLAPVRETFVQLGAFALAALLVGAAGAWLIGRRVTRPLTALTHAAAAMARGDYASRVREDGDLELARLAASFNHMASTVDAQRAELQAQVTAAQAMARDLEVANTRLQEANAQLQGAMAEAGRAHQEAEEARATAEAANRAKSDFLAVMSHELRTPLNAIGGYADLMALGIRGPVSDQQRRDLERIRASQEHLLGLISAVLDLSRIETGRVRYDLTTMHVASFLAGLDGLIEPQAVAKSLTLDAEVRAPDLAVRADREKLRQILLNLLSNAIRYTPAGGRITIVAEPQPDDRVAIAVADTGIGVPADQLERIFEPFVQLDRSLTQVREGVGLGLAISRDLARAMGGDLTASSTVGVGSTFTLVLPAAPAAEARPVDPTGEHRAVTPQP